MSRTSLNTNQKNDVKYKFMKQRNMLKYTVLIRFKARFMTYDDDGGECGNDGVMILL